MKRRGYRSLQELARSAGVHRNTVQRYFSGHGVLPSSVERVLDLLALSPGDAIRAETPPADEIASAPLAPLLDTLSEMLPDACFTLFGSRAATARTSIRTTTSAFFAPRESLTRSSVACSARKGFRGRSAVLRRSRQSESGRRGLSREISKQWVFLAGRHRSWIALQRKAAS